MNPLSLHRLVERPRLAAGNREALPPRTYPVPGQKNDLTDMIREMTELALQRAQDGVGLRSDMDGSLEIVARPREDPSRETRHPSTQRGYPAGPAQTRHRGPDRASRRRR